MSKMHMFSACCEIMSKAEFFVVIPVIGKGTTLLLGLRIKGGIRTQIYL